MEALGQLGLQALDHNALHRLARLYWYTVEFGLAREDGNLKIYGAGILSSFGESHYSLDSAKPHRLGFDLKRVLRTRYRTDSFQQSYFVIDRFEDVLRLVQRGDFPTLYAELDALPDLDPSVVEPEARLAA
jgi:phenylalanine-4-hydroxylase